MTEKVLPTEIIPEEDSEYRTWIYNRVNGEIKAQIVTANEAKELYNEGWRLSPAEFSEEESLRNSPEFITLADDMSQIMNFLLNIDKCKDELALREFAENFLNMKVDKRWKIKTLKERINKVIEEKGLFDDYSN